jgi:hypothetical protein
VRRPRAQTYYASADARAVGLFYLNATFLLAFDERETESVCYE